ncbi:PREDICTED: atherin-like [Lipotes vexillifer]|uniref:Atherin-like n=1 Tax=Lipotes vexillifer TaxID=118797 RepID=A0A340X5R1_LIPVE|nr:PREDICTED: atherin-like [Lipotes vexillifer]
MFVPSVLIHPNTKEKSALKTADILSATANTSTSEVTNPNAQKDEEGNCLDTIAGRWGLHSRPLNTPRKSLCLFPARPPPRRPYSLRTTRATSAASPASRPRPPPCPASPRRPRPPAAAAAASSPRLRAARPGPRPPLPGAPASGTAPAAPHPTQPGTPVRPAPPGEEGAAAAPRQPPGRGLPARRQRERSFTSKARPQVAGRSRARAAPPGPSVSGGWGSGGGTSHPPAAGGGKRGTQGGSERGRGEGTSEGDNAARTRSPHYCRCVLPPPLAGESPPGPRLSPPMQLGMNAQRRLAYPEVKHPSASGIRIGAGPGSERSEKKLKRKASF